MPHRLTRRRFLHHLGLLGLAGMFPPGAAGSGRVAGTIRLFLCGDVMTGRGVDQILPHPASPELYEGYIKDARDYVRLAESANGQIPRPVDFDYVWGRAQPLLDAVAPDARILNLETAVTSHGEPWPAKGINYRMSPDNAAVLKAIGADCCVLANNHVLDWREPGLRETLETLHRHGIRTAGAGLDEFRAREPAVLDAGGGTRVLVFAFGLATSGVPAEWAAGDSRPGVSFLPDLGRASLRSTSRYIRDRRRDGDIVVASMHWGGNWGYPVSREEQRFAHGLIREAGVDVVHGHSSHHPKGIEIFDGRLILYGCGDFLNDYEGIGGYEAYRPDLVAMYLPRLERSGALRSLLMIPLRIERMRLELVNRDDARWLADTLNWQGPDPECRLEARETSLGSVTTPCIELTP